MPDLELYRRYTPEPRSEIARTARGGAVGRVKMGNKQKRRAEGRVNQ